MNWQQLCENPDLQNLPYKIELNERGQIIMSPTRLMHGAYQFDIARKIGDLLKKGKIVTECAVQTRKGTKVADAAWFSPERWEQVREEFDSPIAPEICVEVLSPHNSEKEMRDKKRLYFEKGAEEVWICDEQGNMSFYVKRRKLGRSSLVPEFPKKI
ncbi:MAG: Uma2 family endonuclease [Desulfobacteraceae bacterium]|nr:Uma2 family endonuclease [Desulfobacteraceae bacterium]